MMLIMNNTSRYAYHMISFHNFIFSSYSNSPLPAQNEVIVLMLKLFAYVLVYEHPNVRKFSNILLINASAKSRKHRDRLLSVYSCILLRIHIYIFTYINKKKEITLLTLQVLMTCWLAEN